MTASVSSLPTSETGSGRLSRVAELGALLPAFLDSMHFVVVYKDTTVQRVGAERATMLRPCVTPAE
jgi:hypothetical protein